MRDPWKPLVHRHPDGPYWRAKFRAWNAARQEWIWQTKTTKQTEEGKAMAVAVEYAAIARKAAPNGGRTTLTREDVLDAVNAIVRLAGGEVVKETVAWQPYAQEWLETQRRKKDGSSAKAYEARLRHFTRFLPDPLTPLNSITVQQLRQFQVALLSGGRSATTTNNIVDTVGVVFRQATAEGFMPRNPMLLLKKAKADGRTRDPFTAAEVRQLLAHLKQQDNPDWLTAALLGLCTGQRLRDCTTALWTHIDRTAKPWPVWRLTQGKTKARVEIPLVEPLASHLRSLDTGDSLYLCPSISSLAPNGGGGASTAFTRLLEAAGVTGDKIAGTGSGRSWNSKTFHSLRHTCNSIMANAGVSQDVRRKILGHASDAMNTHYTHLEIATSGNALSSALDAALSKPAAKAREKNDRRPTSGSGKPSRRTG